MTLTIGELKEMIRLYDDDIEISFSGLDFYRLKMRGDKLVQVEFNQTVYKERETGNVIVENHNQL